MKKIHYSWIICIGCTLLIFCTLGLVATAFSVYQPFITDFGNLTKTQSSAVITVRSLTSVSVLFFVNHYYMRLGIRRGMALSVALCALSFFLYSLADSFAGYCAAAAIGGFSHGLGGMYAASLVIHRWFHGHQGLALGICSAGSGFAAIIVPPVITMLIRATSLPVTFRIEAAFVAVSAVLVYLIIRAHPEDLLMKPLPRKGNENETHPMQEENTVTYHGAPMGCMIVAALLLGIVCNGCLANLTMLYSTAGFAAMQVSFLASLAGFTQTAGKFIYGHVVDITGEQITGTISYALLFIGLLLACLAGNGSYPVALCAMALSGLGIPLYSVGLSIYARRISSMEDYPVILKRMQLLATLGGLVFSIFPGIICDLTGSYVPAYAILACCAAVSLILVRMSYLLRGKHKDNKKISAVSG